MLYLLSLLLCFPCLLAAMVLIPRGVVERSQKLIGKLVTMIAGLQCLAAICAMTAFLANARVPTSIHIGPSFQANGTSLLMLLLVSFIGWIACRYSVRYMDGDAGQGRYFQWMSFTLASVCAMALANDLLTFACLWCATSCGLHQLLVHYADRPAAQRAAWTKFTVSRLGDVALVIAIACYYQVVPSLQFSDLVEAASNSVTSTNFLFQIATVALAVGVITKSAQIPFHTWLPLTMETPTPVSALMHAGIVNAGGYLLVRTGPLLSASPIAQTVVVVIGTVTACVASIVMLTQTSIKRKLAYSTISQMGFMLMQCGLGAFSAAMLHILAHSLYKAHEFLSSGSVVSKQAAVQGAAQPRTLAHWSLLLPIMLGLMAITWSVLTIVGLNPLDKPGGWLLTSLLCMALTGWLAQVLTIGTPSIAFRAVLTSCLLIVLYAASFAAVDNLVAIPVGPTTAQVLPTAIVLTCFSGLLFFQIALLSSRATQRLQSLQIHAANGFYIESWLRRQVWAWKS